MILRNNNKNIIEIKKILTAFFSAYITKKKIDIYLKKKRRKFVRTG